MKTTAKIIVSLLIVAVLVFGILFVQKYTNGFTSGFKTFYVQYGDKDILTNSETIKLHFQTKTRIDVRYTLDKNMTGYSVKVVPNVDEDFTFKKDGRALKYSEITDLTKTVDVTKGERYFYVTVNTDLQGILQALYPDAELEDVPVALDNEKAYLTLIVYSANGEQYVEMDVKLATLSVGIDKEGIVF